MNLRWSVCPWQWEHAELPITDKGTPSATAHVWRWVNQAAQRRLFPPNTCDRKVEQNCCSRPTAAYTPTRERALQSARATVNLLAVNTSALKQSDPFGNHYSCYECGKAASEGATEYISSVRRLKPDLFRVKPGFKSSLRVNRNIFHWKPQ